MKNKIILLIINIFISTSLFISIKYLERKEDIIEPDSGNISETIVNIEYPEVENNINMDFNKLNNINNKDKGLSMVYNREDIVWSDGNRIYLNDDIIVEGYDIGNLNLYNDWLVFSMRDNGGIHTIFGYNLTTDKSVKYDREMDLTIDSYVRTLFVKGSDIVYTNTMDNYIYTISIDNKNRRKEKISDEGGLVILSDDLRSYYYNGSIVKEGDITHIDELSFLKAIIVNNSDLYHMKESFEIDKDNIMNSSIVKEIYFHGKKILYSENDLNINAFKDHLLVYDGNIIYYYKGSEKIKSVKFEGFDSLFTFDDKIFGVKRGLKPVEYKEVLDD